MNDEQRSGVSVPKTISLVRLPEDLTGEQALAVFDFLERKVNQYVPSRRRNSGLVCHKWRNDWLIEMVPMYA